MWQADRGAEEWQESEGDPVPWKCVMKAASINILIKASQALESPREQTAFPAQTRGPKPLSQHVNDRTFQFLPVLHCEGVRLPPEEPPLNCPPH